MIFDCDVHGEWDSNRASGCPACMADARREISRLRAALTEARRWLADGDMSDDSGIPSAYWTPAYAAAIDMIDAALTPNGTVRRTPLKRL